RLSAFRVVRRSLWRLTIIPNHSLNVNAFFKVFSDFFEIVGFSTKFSRFQAIFRPFLILKFF
ncbi:MAG: hypothetical protein E7L17_11855, partial [Clostridium sp.]|uniref:hypothetical protein n=1 Tax=Clostridium sp. TaxID=1506 RepID=UPI00290F5358